MSLFKVNVVALNPQCEDRVTPPMEVVVDTGTELTWLPAELLQQAGIRPRCKRTFQIATKQFVDARGRVRHSAGGRLRDHR